jgi:LysR family transcriptional regulator, transcriptional activator of nhaA
MLNFTHLHHFWIIATEGSLTRAAHRLEVSHSTLSLQLKALEKDLGSVLVIRKSRGITLTPAGEHVKDYCDEIFRLSNELKESLRRTDAAPRRAVRVGHAPGIPRELIVDALSPVLGAETPPSVALSVGAPDQLVADLVAGAIHCALVDHPPDTTDTDVYAHTVGETRIGLYASERLARHLRNDFPRSLDGAPMLVPSAGTSLRDALTRWFAEESVRPRIIGEFDDVPLMRAFAQQGRAVVPIREAVAPEAARVFGLERVGPVAGVRERIYVLTLGKRVRHPEVQRLVAACRSAMKQ